MGGGGGGEWVGVSYVQTCLFKASECKLYIRLPHSILYPFGYMEIAKTGGKSGSKLLEFKGVGWWAGIVLP